MILDMRGEMHIEVDGDSIHVMARGDHIVLTLERLGTIAIVTRVLSHLPKMMSNKVSLSQVIAIFPAIIVNVGQDTVLSITPRLGFLSSLLHYRFSLKNKKLWLRQGFQLLRIYFK